MTIPFYVIAASVPKGNRITHFHGVESDSASYLLTNIPRFRHSSFDVTIPDFPRVGADDGLELRWGDRKVLNLFQDGTLLFRARADSDFLGYGVESESFEQFPRLNPVAVVEVHASFVHLYRRVFQRLKHPPSSVFFKLSLKDSSWDDKRLFLTKYFRPGTVDWNSVTKYVIQMDPAEEEVEVEGDDLVSAPNRVAYRILSTFASWFDMPEEDIPFIRETPEGPEVDIDAIKALS